MGPKTGRDGERADGIRKHSEIRAIFDGTECAQRGEKSPESANNAILAEGANGTLPIDPITKAILLRNGMIVYTRPGGWIEQHSTNWQRKGGRSAQRGEGLTYPGA